MIVLYSKGLKSRISEFYLIFISHCLFRFALLGDNKFNNCTSKFPLFDFIGFLKEKIEQNIKKFNISPAL